MKLKRNRLKQFYHRRAVPKKDGEGNSYIEYSEACPFAAEMWAGGGKVQHEMYGIRLPNIRNLRISGDYKEIPNIKGMVGYAVDDGPVLYPGDGICLYVPAEEGPDYRIVAIYPYSFLTLEVEKI